MNTSLRRRQGLEQRSSHSNSYQRCQADTRSRRLSPNNRCVRTSPARAWATIWFLKYRSSSEEVPDEHGMWVGSASTADHLRRDGVAVRGGVAGSGVAARPGALPALAAPRRGRAESMGSRWRWRWRVALAGVTSSRKSRRPGSRLISRSPPIRRRRGAASITPRPTGPTPGCSASCCSPANYPSRGSRRRRCWSGGNGSGSTSRSSINAACGSQRIHAELFQHGVAVPETAIRSAITRDRLMSDEVNLSPAGRQRIRVGYTMLEASDAEAQALKRELQRFGHRQPACRALVDSQLRHRWIDRRGRVVRARRLSPLLPLRTSGAPHRLGRRRRLLRPAPRPWLPDPAGAADTALGTVRSGACAPPVTAAPTTAYYAAVKDRHDGKLAAISVARQFARRCYHILRNLDPDLVYSHPQPDQRRKRRSGPPTPTSRVPTAVSSCQCACPPALGLDGLLTLTRPCSQPTGDTQS